MKKYEEVVKEVRDMVFSGHDPLMVVNLISNYIDENFISIKKNKVKKIKDFVGEWIGEWLDLFPIGIKSGSGLIRSDLKGCHNKMAKFMIDRPEFTKETIMIATRAYLMDRERENYAYTRKASNFIDHRDNGSELAAWCEKTLNAGLKSSTGSVKQEQNYFI